MIWSDIATGTWTLIIYSSGLVAAVDAIWNGRTSQGTLAWVLALAVVPFIALPLYLIFGSRKFHSLHRARKSSQEALHRLQQHQYSNRDTFPSRHKSRTTIPLETLSRRPQTERNHVQLLINGEQTFAHIFQALDYAKTSILIQFYLIQDDHLGQRLQQALIKKAQQGVDVYLLYDQVGSSGLSRQYIRTLISAGVQCSRFNPLKVRLRMQVNFRNHRKLVVIDGETCFIGGHNVGDEYIGAHPTKEGWRDTHLQIDGPATLAAQLSFIEDWYWATNDLLSLSWTPYVSSSNANVIILPGGPADPVETISLSYVHLIQQAQTRLWIATPYFIPDLNVMSALHIAALKGIDIRIILPQKTDNWLAAHATHSYVTELSKQGIQFFQYQAGFMHQKVMLIDDDTSVIGSANLDNRSLRINFELNAIMECQDIADSVSTMLENDLEHCSKYPLAQSPLKMFFAKAARLLSPIL